MTTLQQHAESLGVQFLTRKDHAIQLAHAEADLEARKLAMIPSGGWLADAAKATVDQRKQAAEVAYSQDETCKAIAAHISELRDALADDDATISAIQELASAERWRIRELLATAIMGKTQGEKVEDTAPGAPEFDTAALETAIEFMERMVSDEPKAAPIVDDDIPF